MDGDRTSYSTGIPSDLWRAVTAAPPFASVLSHRHHGKMFFFIWLSIVFLLLIIFAPENAAHIFLFQLFSGTVEGFRTLGQASSSLLCLLKGHMGLRRLCEHHPVVGPLYCLSAVGIGFWVLGRLCAAVLIRTYRMVQTEIYRPSMEPQDYEMVQFLIKRLKLWMGLSKTKEVQIPCMTIIKMIESFINL